MIRSSREEPSLFYTADELRSKSQTFYDRLALLPVDWDSLASDLRWAFCEGNGRPTDPTLYLKCFFVGHFENIERDTDLAIRLSDSISIRLFLFGTLAKSPPDHSSLSRVRRAMADRCDFNTVLMKIVEVMESHGLVGGEAVAMDTSLVPSRARVCVEPEPVCTEKPEPSSPSCNGDSGVAAGIVSSLAEPSAAPDPSPQDSQVPEEAPDAQISPMDLVELEEHLRPVPAPKTRDKRKKLVPSTYDLDAMPAYKPGYKAQPSYKIGVAADCLHRVILASDAYLASVGEPQAMRLLLADLVRTGGKVPGRVVADAGMDDAAFHSFVEFFGAVPVTNLQKNTSIASGFGKERFLYDHERDVYICPAGESLRCRSSADKPRRSYVCPPAVCAACSLKLWCHGSLKGPKQIDRTCDEDSRDRVVSARNDPEHRRLLAMRRVDVEPIFSDFKEQEGLAMIWSKGLPCAQMKAKMAATCWNIKILMRQLESQSRAKAKAGSPTRPTTGRKGLTGALIALCWTLWSLICRLATSFRIPHFAFAAN